MTAEDAIKDIQSKKPLTKKETSKRNWTIGIVLTLNSLLAVSCFVFAFTQQAIAKKQTDRAWESVEYSQKIEKENQELKQKINQLEAEIMLIKK